MQTSCALGGGGHLKAFLRKWHVNLCVEGSFLTSLSFSSDYFYFAHSHAPSIQHKA